MSRLRRSHVSHFLKAVKRVQSQAERSDWTPAGRTRLFLCQCQLSTAQTGPIRAHLSGLGLVLGYFGAVSADKCSIGTDDGRVTWALKSVNRHSPSCRESSRCRVGSLILKSFEIYRRTIIRSRRSGITLLPFATYQCDIAQNAPTPTWALTHQPRALWPRFPFTLPQYRADHRTCVQCSRNTRFRCFVLFLLHMRPFYPRKHGLGPASSVLYSRP